MRAAIYARLSKDTPESTSVSRQREACLAYATARGWDVVAEAEDVDISGTRVAPWDRPGFASLLDRDDLDVIIAYRIDRFGRSVSDFAALLKRLEDDGISVASATEPFDLTEPIGRAMLYLVAVFADLEGQAIAARVRSSIERLRRVGRHSHGAPPFGYRVIPHPDGAGKTLAIEPDEAAMIREAAERYLDGEALPEICRDWNARGLPPRHAASWRAESLRKTLHSDHLLGRVRHRGVLVRDEAGEPLAPFPPLLDLDVWESVQAVRASRPSPSAGARTLLTGLAVCAGCDGPLRAGGGKPPSYKCADFYEGRPCPAPVNLKRAWADLVIEEALLGRVGDAPAVRTVTRVAPASGLADLDAQIRETIAALATSEPGDEADLLALLRRLKDRRSRLEASSAAPIVTTEPLGVTVREAWPSLTTDERRALIARFVRSVRLHKAPRRTRVLDPRRVEVSWVTKVTK